MSNRFNNIMRIVRVLGITLMMFGFDFQYLMAQGIKIEISIQNPIAVQRLETIEIPIAKLEILKGLDLGLLQVRRKDSRIPLVSQTIDLEGDGIVDQFIFQYEFKPKEEVAFVIEIGKDKIKSDTLSKRTFGRFVPERTDDFAWENDKVAFRTYGPEAQRLTESNLPGGTLSSGIDCWLKRVEYPIINKWYKKYVEGGSYHKDDGEGYDPYHVGKSRGCGGVGYLIADSIYVTKNFSSYKIIANGPIRTIFELNYAPIVVNGNTIQERKRISIDLSNYYYQSEVLLKSTFPVNEMVVGLTLHENLGEVTMDSTKGIAIYWESIDDSNLGTGIAIQPKYFLKFKKQNRNEKDQKHILALVKPIDNKIECVAGYGWSKAGKFRTYDDWKEYLTRISYVKNNPILFHFSKKK